jgi:hypothetical protein
MVARSNPAGVRDAAPFASEPSIAHARDIAEREIRYSASMIHMLLRGSLTVSA